MVEKYKTIGSKANQTHKKKQKAEPILIQPLPEPLAGLEPATHGLRMR